ncbi:MAG: type II toxin-antitoxin system RelE/ParE family toxin [Ruminiclostridium sp.]|nr:type II toxin-antitoxin system RelE/ParE family toxin [Ruminiclostridium sp.]
MSRYSGRCVKSLPESEFEIRYLPLFEHDLAEAALYISEVLMNETAANKLIDDTEAAILKRAKSPASFKPYRSAKKREHEYYRINVGNFSVFYVIVGNVMEVRRFIYSKRDIDSLLR